MIWGVWPETGGHRGRRASAERRSGSRLRSRLRGRRGGTTGRPRRVAWLGGARRGRPCGCGWAETDAERELGSGQDRTSSHREWPERGRRTRPHGFLGPAQHVHPPSPVTCAFARRRCCPLFAPALLSARAPAARWPLRPTLSLSLLARAARVTRPMQHIASSDAPALALDDIFHTMSPSPTPQPLPPEPSTSTLPEHHFSFESNALHNPSITDYSMQLPRTSSPEPLDYSELQAMRARVQECALSHNAREAEFAAMVRLSVIWPAVLA